MTVRLIIATGKSNKGREPSSLTCAELHNDNGRNSFTDISLKKHAIDFFYRYMYYADILDVFIQTHLSIKSFCMTVLS